MTTKDNDLVNKQSESLFDNDLANEEDDDEDNLVDAEELTIKKRLRDKSTTDKPPSRLSRTSPSGAASESQDSLNQDEMTGAQLVSNSLTKSNTEKNKQLEKEINAIDKKRNEILKSSSSKHQSVDLDFSTENVNLKTIKSNTSDKTLYTISAEKFSQYESLLFDLIGFTTGAYKIPEAETKKTIDIENDEYFNSKYITNMESLCHKLELNATNQVQIKKQTQNRNTLSSSQTDTDIESVEDNEKMFRITHKAKLVTIILNSSSRPRKAGRILLNKRNTASLDSIINEIANFFKTDNIKKIYNLNGLQILEPIEMYYQDDIFIAITTDKIHNKDFELDLEAMKSSANSLKKSKQTENLIDNSQADMEFMPDELLDNYEVGPVIGEGHYAVVRECKDINTGIMFALKIIDMKKCAGKESMIENELNILRKTKHPNIVRLIEEYRSKHFVYLIFEYYKAGDLLESVRKRTKFLEKDAASMIYSLASALAYLHSMNIVHRDVKLDNILIQQYSDGSKSLKLGDFGLATTVTGPLKQKCGSPVYVAPEVLLGKEYTFEVDVWSLGIIAYILICGYAPFQGQNEDETLNIIKNDELKFVNSDWEKISPEVIDLIKKMLDRNQETRIKAADILNHPWFNKESKSSENSNLENSIIIADEKSQSRKSSSRRLKTAEKQKTSLSPVKKTKNYKSTNVLVPPTFESSSAKIN